MWLSLTFYPIEDDTMVQRLRQRLSTFLRAIQKCSLSMDYDGITKELICDEIINTASSDVDNQLKNDLNDLMRQHDQQALHEQHNALIDVNNLLHISRRSVNCTILFSFKPFQVHSNITIYSNGLSI